MHLTHKNYEVQYGAVQYSTASGLPLTDSRFSSLPPHFVLGEPLLEDNIYKEVINVFGTLPNSFQPVLPYLVQYSTVQYSTV